MKNIILVAIIFVFFTSLAHAQTFGFWDSQSKNSSHITTVGDGTKGTKPLPVRDSVLAAYQYVNKTLSFTDTTNRTMVRDTVSRKWTNTTNSLGVIFSKWIKYTVSSDNDTIIYSSDPSFPANNSTVLYPGESYTSEKSDVYYFLNFYYKVKGWGTATVRWKVEGV